MKEKHDAVGSALWIM